MGDSDFGFLFSEQPNLAADRNTVFAYIKQCAAEAKYLRRRRLKRDLKVGSTLKFFAVWPYNTNLLIRFESIGGHGKRGCDD